MRKKFSMKKFGNTLNGGALCEGQVRDRLAGNLTGTRQKPSCKGFLGLRKDIHRAGDIPRALGAFRVKQEEA